MIEILGYVCNNVPTETLERRAIWYTYGDSRNGIFENDKLVGTAEEAFQWFCKFHGLKPDTNPKESIVAIGKSLFKDERGKIACNNGKVPLNFWLRNDFLKQFNSLGELFSSLKDFLKFQSCVCRRQISLKQKHLFKILKRFQKDHKK